MCTISNHFSSRLLQQPERAEGSFSRTDSPLEGQQPPEEWWPEVDRVLSSIRPALTLLPGAGFDSVARRSNTHEMFRGAVREQPEAKAFKDWFHGFATTLSLLGSRASASSDFLSASAKYRKLLKAELMRGQLQATYSRHDADRLGRARSPVVREGYGRAVRTGLWMAAVAVRTEELRELLGGNSGQLESFEVLPVSRAFEYEGLSLTKLPVQTKERIDLAGLESIYISPLRVQLISKSKVSAAEIDGHFGRHGLRASPSECAEICAESMLRKLILGDLHGAINILVPAFEGEAATAIKNALENTEFQPNTLVAPVGVDPLTSSTSEQKAQVRALYERCCNYNSEDLPFHVHQNIKVVQNLVGNFDDFFESDMPAMVSADLSDALETVFELILQARGLPAEDRGPEVWSLHMERFYQAMQDIHRLIRFQYDWSGREFSLQHEILSLLLGQPSESDAGLSPEDAQVLRSHGAVERAPHALAMLEQIRASLPQGISVAYLAGGYYETPGLFETPLRCESVTHADLPGKDLIIMEPHPNNAAELSVQAHDPVELINYIFSKNPHHSRTLVMDVTLNHLCEKTISKTLSVAREYIDSGRLNLVLLQSGTKFIQNGMDIVSIGLAALFNNKDFWGEFREGMEMNGMYVPEDDERYISNLLSKANKIASLDYLVRIRENTSYLRSLLQSQIYWGHSNANAYEMCVNKDAETVYLALRPTDVYLRRILNKNNNAEVTYDERSEENIKIYKNKFCTAFEGLATVDRSSFGFNVANFGECGETVRITLGVEEPALLREYARRILEVGASLYAEAFESSDASEAP